MVHTIRPVKYCILKLDWFLQFNCSTDQITASLSKTCDLIVIKYNNKYLLRFLIGPRSLTDKQYEGDQANGGHQTVAEGNLQKGELVDGFAAPGIWSGQSTGVRRFPGRQDPHVAADEPDEEKDAQRKVGEPRRTLTASVAVVFVDGDVQPFIATVLELKDDKREDL